MQRETRYAERPALWVLPTIVLSVLLTFTADFFTPLGYAVWIFYLVPVALCHYAVAPRGALWVASGCTLLMLLGFFVSANDDAAVPFAKFNRSLGFVVVWSIAALTFRVNTARLALRREDWLRQGQSELSAAMQGVTGLQELCGKVLQFLGSYLDAHAGVAYLHDGTGLTRVTALAGHPDQPRHVALGEGLLGRAALEGRVLEVHDLPADYLPVRSGLGAARPRSLLILPTRAAGELSAVLELAFLHPLRDDDRTLLAQLAEPIGVAIRVAEQQTRVRELLQETQAQAEELQTQQEELRVANEELTEQGEALRVQAATLEGQQAELEQTNVQIAEHAQALMQQRDDLARAKAEVETAAQRLSAASQYKSEFLANMSHELRTPLNSALILSKLLADNPQGNLSDEQVGYARNIHTAGNDLLELINDILDLSKIEAGKMEVVVDHVVPARLCSGLREMFEPMAKQKGLSFVIQVDEGCATRIETDSQRLRQVLRNLLSNAIKFTDKGEVGVRVFAVSAQQIGFAVHDTGIGIAPEQHALIFEAFQQVSGATTRKYGGTGLGLTISREFTRLLHGTLELRSEPGQGTTFTLSLPVRYEAAAPSPAPALPVLSSPAPAPSRPPVTVVPFVEDDRAELDGGRRTVLIIEDDPAFATLLRDLARDLGYAALVTDSADQGLSLATQHHPVAILLDVKLSDHSGLVVLDRAKRLPALRHIPIHVMSAENHTQRALEMGAASYMLKPIVREQLVQTLHGLDDKFGSRVRRVLVAEDDALERHSICELLKAQNVETVAAGSVAETFAQLKSHTYDCLVLDLQLADGSGFELLERISEEEAYSFPPTIIYTGRMLSMDEELRLRRFSSAVIIKGARSPDRLLDEVTLFLHQVEANLPAERRKMLEQVRSREALFEGRTILVVEDDVRNIFALTSLLEPKRAKLRIARNGREALDALAADADVDLILMDVMMPEMDGLTATRQIRLNRAWSSIPIIALTAKAMRDDMLECLSAGANDYVSKPLDTEKLLSLMRVWMPRRSQLPLGLTERV